jgi:hypothetical protein
MVGGLQDWVLTAERVGLVTANKEGLASFPGSTDGPFRAANVRPAADIATPLHRLPGYLAIYLLGLYLGLFLLPPSPNFVDSTRRPTKATRPQPELCVPVLLGFAAVFWTWLALCRGIIGIDVSRRLVNPSLQLSSL